MEQIIINNRRKVRFFQVTRNDETVACSMHYLLCVVCDGGVGGDQREEDDGVRYWATHREEGGGRSRLTD